MSINESYDVEELWSPFTNTIQVFQSGNNREEISYSLNSPRWGILRKHYPIPVLSFCVSSKIGSLGNLPFLTLAIGDSRNQVIFRFLDFLK